MLKKALQGHPSNNGSQNNTLSQQYKTDYKALKPTQSSLLNSRASWPSPSNPLKRTSSQISGSENLGSNRDEIKIESEPTKVMKSSQNRSRLGDLHANVQFEEDDFDDDNVINLDEDIPPSLDQGVSSSATVVDSVPKDGISDAKPTPSGSTQALPWSSSPLSHLEMPLPRQPLPAAQEGSSPLIPKRRKLPWVAEEQAANAKAALVGSKPSRGAKKRQPPDFVQEMLAKSRKPSSLEEGDASTPVKAESNSPYPWDKTASAIKKEQKKLRNAHQNKMGKEDKSKSTNMVPKETIARVFLSDEQKHVLELVVEKKKSVFFTGSAGTGKSVLLRDIIKVLRDKYKREPDRVAVAASTGLAACNIGGVTLHSFAGIGLGKEDVPELVKKIKRNQKAKQRWLRTKVLIVDEISMVDGDLFDKLEAIARAIRNNGRPFGGIQLVITGDFFQLPPVPDYQKAAKFSFDAGTWNTSIEHTIGLTQVFRQKDPTFANMLNEMRLGRLTPKSIDSFRKLSRPLSFADDFEATELFPTRNEVDAANSARMKNLSTKAFEFDALDGGSIQDVVQRDKLLSNCMAPKSLSLKKGAQVMLIKNIDEQLVNGSVGRVMAFMDERTFEHYEENEDAFQYSHMLGSDDESIALSKQKLRQLINKDGTPSTSKLWPMVRFDIQGGQTRDLLCQSESWKIELPTGEVQASRSQVPLILAWALSIHKAQGQTLNRVKVDLGKIFEKGQAYVALSRATCQEGLQIIRFDPRKVMAHDRVRTFYDGLYSVNHASTLPDTKPIAGGKRPMKLEGDEDSDSLAAIALKEGADYDELVIPAINIANLELDDSRPPSRPPIGDPAIVSFERSSTKPAAQDHVAPQISAETSIYNSTLKAHDRQPDPVSQASSNLYNSTAEKPVSNEPAGTGATGESKANTSATLVQPFSQITLEVPLDENSAAKHATRSQQSTSASGPAIAGAAEHADRQDVRSKRREQQRKSPNPAKPGLPAAQAFAPNGRTHRGTRGKRDRRRMEHNGVEDQNGWATGEVSDLHDMGDFDFEENLSKFDKQKVFDQIKLDDTTADEDRLHTFNRRPRPGTAGGKNLHYSENVLDSPRPIHLEHSSADDEIENGGQSNLNRSARKLPSKRLPSRQGSGIASTEGFMTGSGMLRSSSVRSWSKSPQHDSAEHLSPVIRRDSARQMQGHFTLADSDSYCPCLSPIQMLELEQLATSEFGLSDDMLTENAARCIAESAISLAYESLPVFPKGGLFYVFAGNTKTGARAIAAARHLLNRQIRVVVCLLGSRKEADLLEPVRRQLKMYHDCRGRSASPERVMRRSKEPGAHVDVVLDALLGMHLSFQDLRPSEQKTFSMLATWLNNVRGERPAGGEFRILSLDVPSGVDASTGASPELFEDLEELQHVDLVLSLGAPKTGLLTSWVTETPEWLGRLSIADIGIPNAAWRRFGSSNRKGIDFGSQWVARLEYHGE